MIFFFYLFEWVHCRGLKCVCIALFDEIMWMIEFSNESIIKFNFSWENVPNNCNIFYLLSWIELYIGNNVTLIRNPIDSIMHKVIMMSNLIEELYSLISATVASINYWL